MDMMDKVVFRTKANDQNLYKGYVSKEELNYIVHVPHWTVTLTKQLKYK